MDQPIIEQVVDRLGARKAQYLEHTTLSEVVKTLTDRERELIAMCLHEVEKALRPSLKSPEEAIN